MKLLSTLATLAALAAIGNCQGITKVSAFKDGPTSLGMYVYVPKKLASPAPIIVAIHHCQGSAQGYSTETHYQSLADTHGFILIYPNSRSSGGCFDVSSTASKFILFF
jgi:poly(3-hydroxybutyrate) depolymerase